MELDTSILAQSVGLPMTKSQKPFVDSSENSGNAISIQVSRMENMHRVSWALMLLIAAGGAAHADVVLSGPDSNDGSYSTAALAAAAGGNTVDFGGLTGISLWAFLGGANSSSPTSPVYGAITTSTPAGENGKNAILRYYLVATNATGQQSVVSLGEINPSFGGTSSPAPMVAYKNTGGSLLAAPQLILPTQPGRDLTNLTSLQILSVPAITGPGGVSTAVQLSGNVAAPDSYTLSKLQSQFSPVQQVISGDTYTGVPLWTFLNPNSSGTTNQIVTTQGTDGYEVVLTLAELDPSLGGNPNDLLPYADTGTDFPGSGVARTIFPSDNKHGRWESNLDVVTVTEAPEPGSLTLLLVGLAAMIAVAPSGRRS
jgi:hypothetical protein